MTLRIRGMEYYRTNEACALAGISKNTFLRWVSNGTYPDVVYRDRRGWRLFTEQEVNRLKSEVNRIQNMNRKSRVRK